MRLTIPACLTAFAGLLLITMFLPWHTYSASGRERAKHGSNGLQAGTHIEILVPPFRNHYEVPHYYVLVAVGAAAIGAWLRVGGIKIPAWIPILLTGLATYQSAVIVWYYGVIPPLEARADVSFGPSGYVAFGCCLLAFVVSFGLVTGPTARTKWVTCAAIGLTVVVACAVIFAQWRGPVRYERDKSPEPIDTKAKLAEFASHPERWKGKRVSMTLTPASNDALIDATSIKGSGGADIKFTSVYAEHPFEIVIHIPSWPLPAKRRGDILYLDIQCRDGSLSTGNEMRTVSAP